MFRCATIAFFCVAGLPSMSLAQDAATERARLANQRIAAEAAERARAEAEAADAATAVPAAASRAAPPRPPPGVEATAVEPEATPAVPAAASRAAPPRPPPDVMEASQAAQPSAGPADVTQALEQLRRLGELRDAGYVSDEEFERIKARIIAENF